MPKKVQMISNTVLTDTHDLYIAVESKDEKENGTFEDVFEVYHLDLDDDNPRITKPIFKYPFKLVGEDYNSEMLGFHVRGSSIKEKINLNEILIFYMMHGKNLWYFAQNKE